jgi:hypothetical protein
MFDTTTDARIRAGLDRAHRERAEAIRNAWRWIMRRNH